MIHSTGSAPAHRNGWAGFFFHREIPFFRQSLLPHDHLVCDCIMFGLPNHIRIFLRTRGNMRMLEVLKHVRPV